jgi:hypothetical protein
MVSSQFATGQFNFGTASIRSFIPIWPLSLSPHLRIGTARVKTLTSLIGIEY